MALVAEFDLDRTRDQPAGLVDLAIAVGRAGEQVQQLQLDEAQALVRRLRLRFVAIIWQQLAAVALKSRCGPT